MAKKQFTDALDNLLDRPIAFNPSFKKITGSTNAALLLSQAFYWTKRTTDPDGWFYKTRTDWMEETGLTEAELDGAREKCRAVGVIEEKLKGVPATVHYRVVKPKVYELLGFQFPENPETEIPEKSESGLPENRQIPEKQESGKSGHFNKETENTPRITKENTLIINPITAQLFIDAFGQFNSQREQEKWATLYDSVGPDRATELIAWAKKKEIDLANRPSLLDSLETAAKGWKTSQQRKQTTAQAGDRKAYFRGEYAEFIEH